MGRQVDTVAEPRIGAVTWTDRMDRWERAHPVVPGLVERWRERDVDPIGSAATYARYVAARVEAD
jgi:hypothetical protein